MVLGCVNRTAWGTKLLLTAVWASLVDCISSWHLQKAQHCPLSPNGQVRLVMTGIKKKRKKKKRLRLITPGNKRSW